MSGRPSPQMSILSCTAFLSWVWYAIPLASGAELETSCPPALDAGAVQLERAPVGWVGHVPAPLHLTNAGMMSGEPATMTELVPTARRGGQHASSETWHFSPDGEKWLYCGYGPAPGGRTVLRIGKRMDNSVRICTLTHTHATASAPMAMRLRCQDDARAKSGTR